MWKKTKVMTILAEPSCLQIMINQKQLENVEYVNYLHSMMTNDARYIHEIKSRIATAKAAFIRNKTLYICKLDFNFGKKLVMCCIWNTELYGAVTWTHWKVDQKYLESFEM